ncbi:MAG: hypothetical protein AAB965_03525, partial [Patescibacteria group bacterium]
HIERTKVIVHCISAESEDPALDYKVIRNELKTYAKNLEEKEEYLLITKIDNIDAKKLKKIETIAKKLSKNYSMVSIFDDKLLKEFQDKLLKFVTKVTK